MANRSVLSVVFLSILSLTPLAAQQGRDLYDLGVEKYRAQQNDEAMRLLGDFLLQMPNSVKADDALWYMGRLHLRLEQPQEAEEIFRRILALSQSNRHTEAAYDLGRVLYARKDYPAVIELLAPTLQADDPDLYQRRSMRLVAKSWYFRGLRAKLAYRDAEAHGLYQQAAVAYETLVPHEEDLEDRGAVLTALGKTYTKLMAIAVDGDTYAAYRDGAIVALEEAREIGDPEDAAEAEDLLTRVLAEDRTTYRVTVDGLGGIENRTTTPGAQIAAEAVLVVPLAFHHAVEAEVDYHHNDFSTKSSHFSPDKTGDERLIEKTDTLSGGLRWLSGDRRGVANELGARGVMRWAEDPGDDYWSLELVDDGSWRIDRDWKLMWDTSLEWQVYPDYLVAGRKLDRVEATAAPSVWWRPRGDLDFTLEYELGFRQYLDAKYDTSANGTASRDKQYLFNTVSLEADAEIGRVFRPSVTYTFSILETNNYDEYFTTPNPDVFVEDYYDYLRHELAVDLDFRWTDRLRTQLGAALALRDFTNYPAREDAATYLGETRRDTSVDLDAEVSYVFWTREGGSKASVVVEGWWDKQVSNMTHEATIATNTESYGILAGVSVDLR